MKKMQVILILLILLITILSCSRGNPTTPTDIPGTKNQTGISQSQVNPYRGVFGAWKVILHKDSLQAEIIPARNAQAIGNIFDADLSQFLTVSPCSNCMRITEIRLEGIMEIRMDIQIRHPFANLATRPDLHGFDVRAIFILPRYTEEFPDLMVMNPDATETAVNVGRYGLLNADGFTSHYDNLVTDERYFIGGTDVEGNINPFLRYFDDPVDTDFDPHAPSGHNVMAVGSTSETRSVYLDLNMVLDTHFYIIADVAYGQSATFANRTDPQYYLPAFHRTEPWRVEYWLENNNLDNDNFSSTAELVVQVFDWQHGHTADPAYPNPANPEGLPFSSNCLRLELSIPGLMDDPVVVDTPESGTGAPDDPLQYRFTLQNENGATNVTSGILAVRDEQYGLAGRLPIPESPSGFPYQTQDILDYTLYQNIRINVPFFDGERLPYDYELSVVPSSQFDSSYGTALNAMHFIDYSGKLFGYEWDYDYDGITFDVDGEGMPSGHFDNPDGGFYDVGLRVTTNSVPPRQSIYTIPIYSEGLGFDEDASPSLDNLHSTSINREHAVAMTGGYYFFVFESEDSGKRDIWLQIYDRSGYSLRWNLTSGVTGPCYAPSICVVNEGDAHDGIYVLFINKTGISADLFSIYGNLDGTGFDVSNVEPISTGGAATIRYENCVLYSEGILYSYYWSYNGMTGGRIFVSSSNDDADTWTAPATINTIPSPGPYYNPTVAFSTGTTVAYCVWADYRDSADNGSDLYIAKSSDYLTFTDGTNISSIQGKVDEVAPSLSYLGYQIAIAYKTDDGSGRTKVAVKLLEPNFRQQTNIEISSQYGTLVDSDPCIATCGLERFVVAWGSYDPASELLTVKANYMETTGPLSQLKYTSILSKPVGTVPADGAFVYPCVISTEALDGEASETFIAYRSFEDGANLRSDPFDFYYGHINAAQYIGEGDASP
jgi:hypothetical protein